MFRYQINYSSMLKIQGILSNYVQVTRILMHACMTRELRVYIIKLYFEYKICHLFDLLDIGYI